MGYEIELISKKFYIRVESVKSAWRAIRSLDPYDFGKAEFAWVDGNYREVVSSFEEAVAAWRYRIYRDLWGNVTNIEFTGQKYGDCLIMFKAIAPFVTEGSYLQFEGEDGERWGYHFTGEALTEFRCPSAFSRENAFDTVFDFRISESS